MKMSKKRMIEVEKVKNLHDKWFKEVLSVKTPDTEVAKAKRDGITECWAELHDVVVNNVEFEVPVEKMQNLRLFNRYVEDTKDDLVELVSQLKEVGDLLTKTERERFMKRLNECAELVENIEYEFGEKFERKTY